MNKHKSVKKSKKMEGWEKHKKPTKQNEIIKLLKEIRDRLPPYSSYTQPSYPMVKRSLEWGFCEVCGRRIYPNQVHDHQAAR